MEAKFTNTKINFLQSIPVNSDLMFTLIMVNPLIVFVLDKHSCCWCIRVPHLRELGVTRARWLASN